MKRLLQRLRARVRREMGLGWLMQQTDIGVAHVVPRRDLIEHHLTESCVCAPYSELVESVAGDGWVYVHHSLDGREVGEPLLG